MSEKYNNIDDLFRDNLHDLEVDPPAHLWNNVKAGIQTSGGSGGMFYNGMFTSFSAVLIIIGISALLFLNYQSEVPEKINTTIEFVDSQSNNIESDNELLALKDNTKEVENIKHKETSKE